MISLTGDIATGQKVLAAAAGNLKRTHLELGGKAPVIVFDDADLDEVVDGVRTFGYYNAGQDCTAACRIYAGTGIYDKLVADLTQRRAHHQGRARSRSGRGDGPADLRVAARARRRLRRARRGAASTSRSPPAASARAGSGFFYEPTVVAGARQERRDRAARGVRPGGLGHALQRRRRGDRLGQRFRLRPRLIGVDKDVGRAHAGRRAAAIRLHLDQHPLHAVNEMPHGGLKRSGYGKDLSMYALEDYTVVRHVMVKL